MADKNALTLAIENTTLAIENTTMAFTRLTVAMLRGRKWLSPSETALLEDAEDRLRRFERDASASDPKENNRG